MGLSSSSLYLSLLPCILLIEITSVRPAAGSRGRVISPFTSSYTKSDEPASTLARLGICRWLHLRRCAFALADDKLSTPLVLGVASACGSGRLREMYCRQTYSRAPSVTLWNPLVPCFAEGGMTAGACAAITLFRWATASLTYQVLGSKATLKLCYRIILYHRLRIIP